MSWFIGILLLLIISLTVISYFKKRKVYKIIILSVLIVFFIYSFFTYSGAVRLGITLTTGDIISAYTTKLEKGLAREMTINIFIRLKILK